MKLAVTGLRGIPNVMGGVETHCEELLPRVKAMSPEIEITVFARAPYIDRPSYDFRGVSVIGLPSPKSVFLEAIMSTFNGIIAARRDKMDAIHIHAIGPSLLVPLAKLLGLQVIMTHHGDDFNRAKWGPLPKIMLRMGEKLGVLFADHVIAVSPSLAARLQQSFSSAKNRISYIPNGAPHLPGSPGGALARFSLTPGNYILAVGRLVPEKGLHDLVEAHALASDDKKLVIVGSTDHASDYSKSLMRHASDHVLFTGLQNRGVLRELLENAALFIMPSYHEGLPIAALEAGSCSTPMLLSDIQPNLDIGLPPRNYFPLGDIAALAEALSLPPKIYSVNEADFRRKFDWDEIAERTAVIYRMVME